MTLKKLLFIFLWEIAHKNFFPHFLFTKLLREKCLVVFFRKVFSEKFFFFRFPFCGASEKNFLSFSLEKSPRKYFLSHFNFENCPKNFFSRRPPRNDLKKIIHFLVKNCLEKIYFSIFLSENVLKKILLRIFLWKTAQEMFFSRRRSRNYPEKIIPHSIAWKKSSQLFSLEKTLRKKFFNNFFSRFFMENCWEKIVFPRFLS